MATVGDQYSLDPEILGEFISETEESLAGLDELFVKLENDPNNKEIIQTIFRPIHSVKGNAAFFNLGRMKTLAHDLENLLDLIRSQKLAADKDIIDIIFKGTDMLTAILGRVKAGEAEVIDDNEYNNFLARIAEAKVTGSQEDPYEKFIEQAKSFVELVEPLLAQEKVTEDHLLQIEQFEGACYRLSKLKEGEKPGPSTAIFKDANMVMKIGDVPVTDEMAVLSLHLADPWKQEPTSEVAGEIKKAVDSLKNKLSGEAQKHVQSMFEDYSTFVNSPLGLDEICREAMKGKLDLLAGMSRTEKLSQVKQSDSKKETTKKPAESVAKTMRVAENKIDQFMQFVSELVIMSEAFNYLRNDLKGHNVAREFQNRFSETIAQFQGLSEELQKSILAVRMVPAHVLTQKTPRLVRDLANKLGKEISVEITGDAIDLDKSLVEALDAPMAHLIRNCVDHAIESPEERLQQGKDPRGLIRLSLSKENELVFINISDDGRGIDPAPLIKKSLESGILTLEESKAISKQDALRLIFKSGLSTAKVVSDVSGRGVGMDIVKTSVEGLGGTIDVESQVGVGTTMKLAVPVNITSVVSKVLVTKVDGVTISIPEEMVAEVYKLSAGAGHKITDKEVLQIREVIYRVVRVRHILDIKGDDRPISDGTLILVHKNEQNVALLVDEVLNLQQVVIRQVEGDLIDNQYFSGIGMHGDGHLSMVLNVQEAF